jgi:phosphate transport system protein
MDNYLDALQKQFVQAIFESHSAQTIDLQVAVQLAVVARFYERIGDHAVNIGERVRYVVTGWMPEHKGAARFRARADETGEIARPGAVATASADSGETSAGANGPDGG